jgi:hypothetical protein
VKCVTTPFAKEGMGVVSKKVGLREFYKTMMKTGGINRAIKALLIIKKIMFYKFWLKCYASLGF